jgi:hypothetical protein
MKVDAEAEAESNSAAVDNGFPVTLDKVRK